jgi:hypothetical protein
MNVTRSIGLAFLLLFCASRNGLAQNRVEGDFILNNFTFHDGSTLTKLSMHYVTLGDPESPAVLVLHGTAGNGSHLGSAVNCLARASRSMQENILSFCQT